MLYVEDDEDSREALKMFLEMHGCEVVGASNAEAGLDALREEPFHLVVTDFNLPDRDGASMLDDAAAAGVLDGEAVIVTGSCQVRSPSRPVLVKPIDPRDVLKLAVQASETRWSRSD